MESWQSRAVEAEEEKLLGGVLQKQRVRGCRAEESVSIRRGEVAEKQKHKEAAECASRLALENTSTPHANVASKAEASEQKGEAKVGVLPSKAEREHKKIRLKADSLSRQGIRLERHAEQGPSAAEHTLFEKELSEKARQEARQKEGGKKHRTERERAGSATPGIRGRSSKKRDHEKESRIGWLFFLWL